MKLTKEKAIAEISRGVFLTFHAVEQYISRWKKDIEFPYAVNEIAALLFNSHILDEKTAKGDRILVSNIRSDIRFVLSVDNFIVTTLPPSRSGKLDLEELQEIFDEEMRQKANYLKIQLDEMLAAQSLLEEEVKVATEAHAKAAEIAKEAGRIKSQICAKADALNTKISNLKKNLQNYELPGENDDGVPRS